MQTIERNIVISDSSFFPVAFLMKGFISYLQTCIGQVSTPAQDRRRSYLATGHRWNLRVLDSESLDVEKCICVRYANLCKAHQNTIWLYGPTCPFLSQVNTLGVTFFLKNWKYNFTRRYTNMVGMAQRLLKQSSSGRWVELDRFYLCSQWKGRKVQWKCIRKHTLKNDPQMVPES